MQVNDPQPPHAHSSSPRASTHRLAEHARPRGDPRRAARHLRCRTARCAAATPTRPGSTRRARPTNELAAAGADYDRDFSDYLTSTSRARACPPTPAALPAPVAARGEVPRPGVARHPAQRRPPQRRQPARPIVRVDGQHALRAARSSGARGRSPAAGRTAPTTPLRVRQRGRGLPGGAGVQLHRGPAAEGAAHSTASSFDAKHRLLPAVLRRDGAAAADGRHPRPGRHRLHAPAPSTAARRVRRARPRRPLVGRGLLPELRLGDVRPDAAGRPAASQAAGRRRGRLAGDVPRARRRGEPRATRAPARRRRSGPPWPGCSRRPASSPRCCWRWAGVLGAGAAPHRRRPALTELERALRRTRRGPAPGTTLQALEPRFARSPAAAGYVRALREQRYAAAAPDADPAPSAAGCGASWAAARGLRGRLRAWWALPPRRSGPGPTLGRRWPTSTTSTSAGRRCWRRGDFHAATVAAGEGARPRPREDLDPRGARPRVLPLAARSRRPGRVRGASSSARRRTTTRCSASAARCWSSAADGGAQGRSRWPPDCARTAATTASTGTAHEAAA